MFLFKLAWGLHSMDLMTRVDTRCEITRRTYGVKDGEEGGNSIFQVVSTRTIWKKEIEKYKMSNL